MRLREIGRTRFLFHSEFYASDGLYANSEAFARTWAGLTILLAFR